MSVTKFAMTLPDAEVLRQRCQTLAVLDAILCPDWEYRYFSFNATWGENEMMASMRNGEGDDWLLLFNADGAILKGFAHDAPMAEGCPHPGVIDHVPEVFQKFLADPAFSAQQTTFCLWRLTGDDAWTNGAIDFPEDPDPDGSSLLLRFLDGNPETYCKWGEEYFGTRLNPNAIAQMYRFEALSPFIVRALNTEVQLDELRAEIEDIGYPL
jgi:hypothetical protein